MQKTALILTITAFLSVPALAQFPQMKRAEQRMEQMRKADEERQKSQDAEDIAAIAVPKPKAAVMNVDVQSVLVKQDARSFAEAKPNAVKDVLDGDPLWLFVKFNGKLGDYVHTVRDKENGGQFRHLLYLEAGPKGDITALTRYVLEFSKSELEQTELKINLAPGIPGRNAASPALIEVAGTRSPGAWGNELRLTNTTVVPRSPTDNLAVSDLTFNFQRNYSKYPKMRQDFTSMMLRGTTNASTLPLPGGFYNLPVKLAVTDKLKSDAITPVRVYFASDNWLEYGPSALHKERVREVFAVFTYRAGAACNYGVAKISQKYDPMADRFVDGGIEITKGLPLACTDLE